MKLKEALISEHYSVERFSEKEADMLSDNVNIDDFLYETDELDIVENDKINCVSNKHKGEKQKLKKIKLNLKLKRKQKYDEETAIRVKQFVNVNEKVSADVSDSSENKSSKLWHTPENILNKTQNTCKQFQCQLCGDVFKWKSVLKKHLNTHSPNKAKFACSLCPKRFTRKEYISIHMRIHAGVRPFVCEICARSFVKRQDLIRHKSLHSDERNFSCSECNKKFKRSADVHAHMRTHTGVVPYSCKRCSKGYKSRTGMLKHYNKNQCGGLHVLTKCEIANIDIHNNENKRS